MFLTQIWGTIVGKCLRQHVDVSDDEANHRQESSSTTVCIVGHFRSVPELTNCLYFSCYDCYYWITA